MALQNGSAFTLKKLALDALNWLTQSGLNIADPTVGTVSPDPGYIIPTGTLHSFSTYKEGGLSDDAAMSVAVSQGGTLIIDQTIHLTRTFTLLQPMQIISNASKTSGGPVIFSSSPGGLFLIAAPRSGAAIPPILFQGLNIIDTAASGSIIVMSGDHTTVSDCQFANVAGNSSSMVKFQGYDQVIKNSNFSNYEPTAYSWDANWVGVYNGFGGEPVNDRVVGGSAFGPGKGGLIVNAGSHFTEGFSVDDWVCATQGVQIQASDVYSLQIRGGVFDGATGSAIVLGGGNVLVQSVVIQGAFISAAGIAIDAAPSSGSGVNDLTVQDNQISGAGTGIAINGRSGHIAVIGNTITSSSLGLSIQNPASQVMVIDNTVTSGGVSISNDSTTPNQVYINNTFNSLSNITGSAPSSVIFTSNGGNAFGVESGFGLPSNVAAPVSVVQAVQVASTNVQLPNFTQTSNGVGANPFGAPSVSDTFSHFKNPTLGTVLTDDQAFSAAVAALGAVHGTLVIDNGLTINLTQAVRITQSMAIVSAGSGLDTSSLITTSAAGGIFNVSTAGSVLIQGLNLHSGSSGSIITTGTGNTMLRDDSFTNVAGCASPMVLLQGPNQLIQDSNFQNNEASSYDWSAAYVNPSTATDTSTTISGGSAYGVGKGGLIGGDDAGPVIQGFNIENWTIVSKGVSQIVADNVKSLDIEGGVFDYSSACAIVLGGGATRISSVTVNGAFISAAGVAVADPTAGIGINAGLATGGGVASLIVTDNLFNTVGTGVLVGGRTGNVTVSGNDLRTGKIGLDLLSPTGTLVVVGNQDNPTSGAIALQSTAAIGSTQSYLANTFNGAVLIGQTNGSTLTSLDNIGSGSNSNALAVHAAALPPATPAVPLTTVTNIAIPPAVVPALSMSDVAALTAAQFGALTTAQIGTLTTAQISALTSRNVGALTTTQVAALTTAQLLALSPLQMVGFNPTQLAAMNTGQLVTLTTSQFGQDHLFDASYYLAENPDVAAAGVDPYQHYMTTGWKEGRNPSPFFNTKYYLAENPDVAAAGVDPLAQFAISGWDGSTNPSAAFSDSKYLAANPDVVAVKMDPLLHYMISGQYEGRAAFASSSGASAHADGTGNTAILRAPPAPVGAKQGQLVLRVSETAWQGNAQFSLTIDGAAASGTLTASASRAAGQSQAFTVAGLYAPGPHTIGVNFLNSHGNSGGERKLFIDGMTFNGQDTAQSASLVTNGTALLSTSSTTRSTAVTVNLSEDAFYGDAMALISIDGKVQGGVQTVSASHSTGASQPMRFLLDLAPGAHAATVTLINGLNDNSGASRNLYIDAINVAGMTYSGASAALRSNGPTDFTFSVEPAPVLNGSLYVTASAPSAMSLLAHSASL